MTDFSKDNIKDILKDTERLKLLCQETWAKYDNELDEQQVWERKYIEIVEAEDRLQKFREITVGEDMLVHGVYED